MAAADGVTAQAKAEGVDSDTIRGWGAPSLVRCCFSLFQFLAAGLVLVPVPAFSPYLFVVVIVQCTAFLMTLQRKNVCSHRLVTVTYAALLLAGGAMSLHSALSTRSHCTSGMVGFVAYMLRVAGMGKYQLWSLLSLLVILVVGPLTAPSEQGGVPALYNPHSSSSSHTSAEHWPGATWWQPYQAAAGVIAALAALVVALPLHVRRVARRRKSS